MYATVEQADAYVKDFYSSTSPISIAWEALEEGDKQVLLNRAEQAIDQIPFKGRPIVLGKAFPRNPNKDLSLIKARDATIELALQTHGNPEKQERYLLQSQGVKQYKIGDLSETFRDGAASMYGIDTFTYSIIFPLLSDWMGGGYRICPTRIKR